MTDCEYKNDKVNVKLHAELDNYCTIRGRRVPLDDVCTITIYLNLGTDVTVSIQIEPLDALLSEWQRLLLAQPVEVLDGNDNVIMSASERNGTPFYCMTSGTCCGRALVSQDTSCPCSWLQEPLSAAIAQITKLGLKFAEWSVPGDDTSETCDATPDQARAAIADPEKSL